MNKMNRRKFLGGLAAASAFTIVPRRVLGGAGYVPPSDMILLAQVGCGTQAQRQVNTGLVRRPDVQFVAVVDPNRDTQNYVDWNTWGNRNTIRRFLEEPNWGSDHTGIRAGRDVAQRIMETYYKKQSRPGRASAPTRTTARCSRRKPTSRASSTSRRTTSTASINISALQEGQGGDRAQAGRQRALRSAPHAARPRARAPRRRTCSPTATRPTGTRSRPGSRPA